MSARHHILYALWIGLIAVMPTHGQQLLIDINTQLGGPEVRELATIGTKVFIAGTDGSLWVTDEAVTAVRRITALDPPISRGLTTHGALFALDDRVLIRVNAAGPISRVHLWVSDGTESGTRPLLEGPVYVNNGEVDFARAGKWAYFHGSVDGQLTGSSGPGVYGNFVWQTDGTPAGTRPVVETDSQSSSYPLVGTSDKVFFSHHDVEGRRATVSVIDVTTDEVMDLFPGEDVAASMLGGTEDFVLFRKRLPGFGWEPWLSDGTREGTRRLSGFNPGLDGSEPVFVGVVRDRLVFKAAGWLWSTDGSMTEPEALLETNAYLNGMDLDNPSVASTGGLLFFAVNNGLWVTDGTQEGTRLVSSQPATDNTIPIPWSLVSFGQSVFFQWEDPLFGLELWTSDGSLEGTHRLTDLRTGPVGVNRLRLAPTYSGVLVAPWPSGPLAPIQYYGGSDGSLRDARFVFGNQAAPGSDPGDFVDFADGFLFTAARGGHGREVWFSDGSRNGTRRLQPPDPDDLRPEFRLLGQLEAGVLAWNAGRLGLLDPKNGTFSPALSAEEGPVEIYSIVTSGDVALMLARSAASTPEFWLSDGTTRGTRQVTGFDYGRLNVRAKPLGRLGHSFLFIVERDLSSTLYAVDVRTFDLRELYSGWDTNARRVTWLHDAGDRVVLASEVGLLETDGTREGTRPWGFEFREMIRYSARLGDVTLFAPNGPNTGEIWKTDGTEAGTRLVERLCPPQQGCDWVENMFRAGDRVFIVHPYQDLWVSDGTPEGTVWLPLQPSLANRYELLARDDEQLIFEVRQGYSSNGSVRSLWAVDVEERRFRRLIETEPWLAAGLQDISDGRILGNRMVFAATNSETGRELFFVDLDNPRGVATASQTVPARNPSLSPPYPNPLQDRARALLTLAESGNVQADVLDLLGRRVAIILQATLPAGQHELELDLANLPAAVYLIRVETPSGRLQRKVVKID